MDANQKAYHQKIWVENYKDWPIYLQQQYSEYNQEEQKTFFENELTFGTAGMRGIMGPGSARMNVYNVRRITLAFASFLKQRFSEGDLSHKGIFIGCDNRNHSFDFLEEAAMVLASCKIKVLRVKPETVLPTPVVSFGVTHFKTIGGIVITSSHNSKEYNGYKIYDEAGIQYLPAQAQQIYAAYLTNLEEAFQIQHQIKLKMVEVVDYGELKQAYLNAIKALQFYPDQARKIKIVFSNLHGVGKDWTPNLLRSTGYKVITVDEQFELDGNFSTCPSPNPEIVSNFNYAFSYAQEYEADLIILNDPDADRIGVAIKKMTGQYEIMSTNTIAALLLDYLLLHKAKNQKNLKNSFMVRTLVSSDWGDAIAKDYQMKVYATDTGFKWIATKIKEALAKKETFVLGFEEACGFILSNDTHDKDGIQASLIIAEMVDFYHQQGLTLFDVIEQLSQKYGYYESQQYIHMFEAHNALEQQKAFMQKIRQANLKKIGSYSCTIEDYQKAHPEVASTNLLIITLENGSWVAVRPSGTEPKVKFYYTAKSTSSRQEALQIIQVIHEWLLETVKTEA